MRNRNLAVLVFLFLALWTTSLFASAQDSTAQPAPADSTGNIADIVAADERFSTLLAAVDAAGLTETLASGGPFTVFAPTNAAFEDTLATLGITADQLLADTETLTAVLLYHVIDQEVFAETVFTLDGQAVMPLLPDTTISIAVIEGGVVLNDDVTVIETDIAALNGVIHVIDSVLLPPFLAPAAAPPAEAAEAQAEAAPETSEAATEEATEETTEEVAEEATPEATQEATQEAPAAAEAAPADTSPLTYRVQPGDNLFRIALRFDVSLRELASANGITNPALIYVGQVLTIPGVTPTPTPDPGAVQTYVVQPGDTLYSIAVRFRTTIGALSRLNNLANPNLLFVGQRILVPDPNAPAPTATTPAPAIEDAPAEATTEATAEETPEETPEATTEQPQEEATPEATTEAAAAESAPEATEPIGSDQAAPGIVVFIQGQDVDALVSQVVQLGVDWVKLTINWRDVELVEGTLALDNYDAAIDAFSQAGLNVLVQLTGAPDWARPTATDFVLSSREYGPPDDVADFGEFAGEIAARYAQQVAAYEIWEEPNLRRNWISPSTTDRNTARMAETPYTDLFQAAVTAIREANPAAQVVTAGLAPTGLNDRVNAIDDRLFLRDMLASGAGQLADGIGVHPDGFANPPDARSPEQAPGVDTHFDSPRFFFLDTLSDYREIATQAGVTLPLWVTRFGWGTSAGNDLVQPDEFSIYLTYNSPEEQAIYTSRAFELADELGYVGPMILTNLNGCQVNRAEACYYSLVDSTNSARPAFTALTDLLTGATP